MNVFNPKKGETNAKRNSPSLKTNRQPLRIKFDSYNPVNDLKDPNIPRMKERGQWLLYDFKGVRVATGETTTQERELSRDAKLGSVDELRELDEDFQERSLAWLASGRALPASSASSMAPAVDESSLPVEVETIEAPQRKSLSGAVQADIAAVQVAL